MSQAHQEINEHVNRVWDYRQRLVDRAKEKGVSAAFHIALVRSSQAIERAEKAKSSGEDAELDGALEALKAIKEES